MAGSAPAGREIKERLVAVLPEGARNEVIKSKIILDLDSAGSFGRLATLDKSLAVL